MGPVRTRHGSHQIATQSSHFVDRAGRQAKMTSIDIWIPWRNAHKPNLFFSLNLLFSKGVKHTAPFHLNIFLSDCAFRPYIHTSLAIILVHFLDGVSALSLKVEPFDSARWGLGTLCHGIQNSMGAILACHPAQSTEWLDWVAKWCEWWRVRTGPICGWVCCVWQSISFKKFFLCAVFLSAWRVRRCVDTHRLLYFAIDKESHPPIPGHWYFKCLRKKKKRRIPGSIDCDRHTSSRLHLPSWYLVLDFRHLLAVPWLFPQHMDLHVLLHFLYWGFGWVDKAQCFRSARRFGAAGSSPDFSRVFHDMVLLGLCLELSFDVLVLC